MIPLLLDMGLPRGAAEDLRAAGWDVAHVSERAMRRAPDEDILALADAEGRVVVTLDSDFSALLAHSHATTPSVIFVRLSGVNRASAVELLGRVVPQTLHALRAGCILSVTSAGVRIRALPLG